MDTKALAKSKRAHSLHHSKKHQPHQAVKAPSSSSGAAGGGKKPAAKQAREKSQQSHGSRTLLSNWDRYGEEFDFGSEDAIGVSTNQPAEFVVPKSKGADYAHLISEARAQPLDIFSSFNDVLDDFTQDYGPLVSEKGQSILSWISDDSFELEEKASTSLEVPFLSLNLNALAEQLAKVKLSKRLFVDPEVIPPELLDDELQTCVEDKSDQSRTCTSFSEPIEQEKESDISNPRTDSVERRQSKFDAESAEAELDMLLNSFGETVALEPSSSKKPAKLPANIDATIDDLLNEISHLPKIEQSSGVKTSQDDVPSTTLHASSKSKLLDDFDSWLDTI